MKINKIVFLLTLLFSHLSVMAQLLSEVDLSSLDGQNGFVINGESLGLFGGSVSSAGDVNGDGLGDFIVGAPFASSSNSDVEVRERVGKSYVIFGSEEGFSNPFDLSTLDGGNGFVINGENADDLTGYSVSSAGDVNSDGIDDLVIGAYGADPYGGPENAGRSYVIFGSDEENGFSSSLNVTDVDGENGFVINGENMNDYSGVSVSLAGDVNGDGVGDLIIGADFADPHGLKNAGVCYVIFGKRVDGSKIGFPHPFNLSTLDGENGFAINGGSVSGFLGREVSSAGDVNGDGIDDLIMGAASADIGGQFNVGKSYVIFGSDEENGLPHPFNLVDLNGDNGFVIIGENEDDSSGRSASSAGDVNGDGIDDLIVGASGANKNYVIYGRRIDFPHPFNLSTLDGGRNGFVINGENAGDALGSSVSALGDLNGDQIDDLFVGAPGADPDGRSNAGKSYVVFGRNGGLPNPFNLSNLNIDNCHKGITINGESIDDLSGWRLSSAGDVNGDEINDLIIGVPGAGSVGKSYVIFGKNDSADIGGDNGDTIFKSGFECI